MNQDKLQGKKISFFVIDYSMGGGVERVTCDLMNLFLENSLPVYSLVSLYKSNEESRVKYNDSIRVDVINPANRKNLHVHFIDYFVKNKTDIFIFQADNMTIALSIMKAAFSSGVIAIPQYHGSPYAYLKKYADAEHQNYGKRLFAKMLVSFKKRKLKKLIDMSRYGFVCVSNRVTRELKYIYNVDYLKHLVVIYNPIPLKLYHEGDCKKEKVVSFVSRLERKHKNAFLSVKAWSLIAKQFPDWTLRIYGEGSLMSSMQAFVKCKDIKNVEFVGFSPNVRQELMHSSISISTSNCEGFSMAVAEAIATRNAIACTNSDGGVKDMVKQRMTGLISPKNDAKALSRNIAKLIDDEQRRKRYVDKALERLNYILNHNTILDWRNLLIYNLEKKNNAKCK